MRRLMWLTLGFAGACILGAYVLPVKALWIEALCVFPLATAALLWGRKNDGLRRVVVFHKYLLTDIGWRGENLHTLTRPGRRRCP